MRIDNQMAGFRPPALKRNSVKKSFSLTEPESGVRAHFSGNPAEVGQNYEKHKKDHPKEYVHKQNKLQKAAYHLATRGAL